MATTVEQTIETIKQKKDKFGISLAELARRTGIDYEALRNSLEGTRNLRATELIELCKALELDIPDFDEQPV